MSRQEWTDRLLYLLPGAIVAVIYVAAIALVAAAIGLAWSLVR